MNTPYLVFLFLCAFLTASEAKGPASKKRPDSFSVKGKIKELSGATYDQKRKVLWTLGDSGKGERRLIAQVDIATSDIRVFKVTESKNIDWEAIVLTPNDQLWILDTGDNKAKRPHVELYRIDLRLLNNDTDELKVAQKITVKYEKSPIDIEAGFVIRNTFYLVEKTDFDKSKRKPKVFSFQFSDSDKVVTAKLKGYLPRTFRFTTDIESDQKGNLYFLTLLGIQRISPHADNPLLGDKKLIHPLQLWGKTEALAFVPEESAFLVGSENGKIVWIP